MVSYALCVDVHVPDDPIRTACVACCHAAAGLDPSAKLEGPGLIESLLFHMSEAEKDKELKVVPALYVPRNVSALAAVSKPVFLAAWRRVAVRIGTPRSWLVSFPPLPCF